MTTYWVKYNFSYVESDGPDYDANNDHLSFQGFDLYQSAQLGNGAQPDAPYASFALISGATEPLPAAIYLYYKTIPYAFVQPSPNADQFIYLDEEVSISDAYEVGTKAAPNLLVAPALTTSPAITSYNGSVYQVQYSSFAWEQITVPGPDTPPRYALHFNFAQGVSPKGRIAPGTLSATVTDEGTGNVVWSSKIVPATADDAFPLLSGFSNEKTPTKYSTSFSDIVYPIDGLAASFKQQNVEIHVGNPNPNGSKIVSLNSESCLVVSKSAFLDPLKEELRALAVAQGANVGTDQALSTWINAHVDDSVNSQDPLSQPTINVEATGRTAFNFAISRPIEKTVKVLYSVTNDRTGHETNHQTLIDPYKPTSAIVRIAGRDAQTIDFTGYLVKGSVGGKVDWYFDGRQGHSSDTSGEQLMFGSARSITIGGSRPQSVAKASSNHDLTAAIFDAAFDNNSSASLHTQLSPPVASPNLFASASVDGSASHVGHGSLFG